MVVGRVRLTSYKFVNTCLLQYTVSAMTNFAISLSKYSAGVQTFLLTEQAISVGIRYASIVSTKPYMVRYYPTVYARRF